MSNLIDPYISGGGGIVWASFPIPQGSSGTDISATDDSTVVLLVPSVYVATGHQWFRATFHVPTASSKSTVTHNIGVSNAAKDPPTGWNPWDSEGWDTADNTKIKELLKGGASIDYSTFASSTFLTDAVAFTATGPILITFNLGTHTAGTTMGMWRTTADSGFRSYRHTAIQEALIADRLDTNYSTFASNGRNVGLVSVEYGDG